MFIGTYTTAPSPKGQKVQPYEFLTPIPRSWREHLQPYSLEGQSTQSPENGTQQMIHREDASFPNRTNCGIVRESILRGTAMNWIAKILTLVITTAYFWVPILLGVKLILGGDIIGILPLAFGIWLAIN